MPKFGTTYSLFPCVPAGQQPCFHQAYVCASLGLSHRYERTQTKKSLPIKSLAKEIRKSVCWRVSQCKIKINISRILCYYAKQTVNKGATIIKRKYPAGCGTYMFVCECKRKCVWAQRLISRQKPERCSVTKQTLMVGEGEGERESGTT